MQQSAQKRPCCPMTHAARSGQAQRKGVGAACCEAWMGADRFSCAWQAWQGAAMLSRRDLPSGAAGGSTKAVGIGGALVLGSAAKCPWYSLCRCLWKGVPRQHHGCAHPLRPSQHTEVYNLSPCKLHQNSVLEDICASHPVSVV